jgi:hypothetical protein
VETPDTTEAVPERRAWAPSFGEYLLGGILVLVAAIALLAVFLYLLPPEELQLPELQPALRVGPVGVLPVGAGRTVRWGDQVILVVRADTSRYAALEGVAPTDGCMLQWSPTALRIESPCTYIVYDLHGNVVRGLTTVPLTRYTTFVRDDVLYIGRP